MNDRTRRLLEWPLLLVLPVVVALWAAVQFKPGATFAPWRPNMEDLRVYRLAGEFFAAGKDFYDLPHPFPFIYPPFAALLFTVLPWFATFTMMALSAIANALLTVVILAKCGLRGWPLSFLSAAALAFAPPVRDTLVFGQLGMVLVAAGLVDLVHREGPDGRPRSPWWEGILTGLATGIKLTPAVLIVMLWAAGKRRAAMVATGTFLATVAVGFLLRPTEALGFWSSISGGARAKPDAWLANQGMLSGFYRFVGAMGPAQTRVGLALIALVVVAAVVAAALWARRGQWLYAVCLAGVVSVMANPIAWVHHMVWTVALAVAVTTAAVPTILKVMAWFHLFWVWASAWWVLPSSTPSVVELDYTFAQATLAGFTALWTVAMVAVALATAVLRTPSRRWAALVTGAPEPAAEPVRAPAPAEGGGSTVASR
ncbi:glycosyltransferase 87 family protein [Mariniluteicoccus flavus]